MKIYNSMKNKVEELKPIREGEVMLYVCGPTVYNDPHIGNARPMIVFDTLKKTLSTLGYHVKFVSNYTDVDDKIILEAKKRKMSEEALTTRYIDAYNRDRRSLNVDMPDAAPKVTQTMDDIIAFIALLIEKGAAYEIDGDVYFRVKYNKQYGDLSNQKIDDLLVGARIEKNSKKENALDFTLWKKTEEGLSWNSPWSQGRPGWHTECVVMIHKEFATTQIDIHAGGIDLKFPHHENEIAQARAAYGSNIANYWMHNGMLNIDGDKMSKSFGNVILIKDLVKDVGGNIVRWVMLSAHYRSPLMMNDEVIASGQTELEKVKMALNKANVQLGLQAYKASSEHDLSLWNPFIEAMQEDLNTPNAFKALFDAIKILNARLREKEVDLVNLANAVYSIEKMLFVLGINISKLILTEEDLVLYHKWKNAVKEKDFANADVYRKELMERGIL